MRIRFSGAKTKCYTSLPTTFTQSLLGSIVGLVALASASTTVFSGGHSLGEADTDILFEHGKNNLRVGYVYISPDVAYTTIDGTPAGDSAFSDPISFPSLAYKHRITDDLACALTYAKPFGAWSTYGPQAQQAEFTQTGNPTFSTKFNTEEIGATCGHKFGLKQGNLHILGGAFWQNIKYRSETGAGALDLEGGWTPGYRLGVAYEIPEIAMRMQVMYRSGIEHKGKGVFKASPFGQAVLGLPAELTATGQGNMPQSVKLSAQTGVAPGWLAFGSLTWTDWSALQTLDYNIGGILPGQEAFYYKDGLTAQLGIAHAFTEKLSGSASLTWDQGVGSGADITTDVWIWQLGAEYDTGAGKIGGGLSFARVTGGEQSTTLNAPFNAATGKDWAIGAGLSYSLAF